MRRTAYSHAAPRAAHSSSDAPAGHTSHVVVSSGRSASAAQWTVPPSVALSVAFVHLGAMHSSVSSPANVLESGKQRFMTSCVAKAYV